MLRHCLHRGTRFTCNSRFSWRNACSATYELHDMANLAESSVLATQGGTVVHATVCSAPSLSSDDFLPLTVDYRDRYYASRQVPSTANRRERHGSENEVLIARVIDRAIRPLFVKGYTNEVQVTVTAHAIDGVHDPVVLAVNAVSHALMHSNQPWNGPVACTRIGMIDRELVIDPPSKDMSRSYLNLLYAGTAQRPLMIEVMGDELPESEVSQAMTLAQRHIQHSLETSSFPSAIMSDTSSEGHQMWTRGNVSVPCYNVPPAVFEDIRSRFFDDIASMFLSGLEREKRSAAEGHWQNTVREYITTQYPSLPLIVCNIAASKLMSEVFRSVVRSGRRVDGRKHNQLRLITPQHNILPTVHGSSLFYRGDTRVLCTATLASVDGVRESRNASTGENDVKDYFYLHYDFPPYCTGETGNAAQINRRMIGHGNLAEKALKAIIPAPTEFPYVIRVFSECTASNGSSSMASVCGASLALLDAGVPIKNIAAGLSVGLVSDAFTEQWHLLTDILGTEDHYGDMDFKVAGTRKGVTAIQLDAKLALGVPLQALHNALLVAREARCAIIDTMEKVLRHPISNKPHVPYGAVVRMHPDKKRHLIGPGGEMRRFIETTYDCQVTILEDDNLVYLFGSSRSSVREAELLVQDLVVEIQEGDIYRAEVVGIRDFGALVRLTRAQTALLHISELSHSEELLRKPVSDLLAVGQRIEVKVLHVDSIAGNTRVSRKALLQRHVDDNLVPTPPAPDDKSIGVIPDFPVTPPRQFDLSYFATRVASESDVKKAMDRQNLSRISGNINSNRDASEAKEAKSKPPPSLAESLADSLNDDLISDAPRPKLTHALDRFKRGYSSNRSRRAATNGRNSESNTHRGQRQDAYDIDKDATKTTR